jgi:hypothetical protein
MSTVEGLVLIKFDVVRLEAAPGIEPGVAVLQTAALPLGYAALKIQRTI